MMSRHAIEVMDEYLDDVIKNLKEKGAKITSVSVVNNKFLILYKSESEYKLDDLIGG